MNLLTEIIWRQFFMNNLIEQSKQLKAKRLGLIKQLANIDKRISVLAEEVQQIRSRQFREKHNLRITFGDTIPMSARIREYAQSQFVNVLNPIMFVGEEAKVIGYDYEHDFVLLGSTIQDPAPIRVPVTLIT
jgi:hypothetical protein